jgi:hypothetical protein
MQPIVALLFNLSSRYHVAGQRPCNDVFFLPMHLFVLAAGAYFLLAWPMSLLARHFEKLLHRGYRGSAFTRA